MTLTFIRNNKFDNVKVFKYFFLLVDVGVISCLVENEKWFAFIRELGNESHLVG